MPIEPEDLDPDPLRELERWLEAAAAAELPLPNAFALATADASGQPSVRMVLLRDVSAAGVTFFTNRFSRKGIDLAAVPRAAGVLHWPALRRQVRFSGPVTELDATESTAYWQTRPRGSQLSAWASAQSEPIADRSALEEQVAAVERRFPEGTDIPLPPFWGGYRLTPDTVEFWESRPNRLHDRIEYRWTASGWERRRLQP